MIDKHIERGQILVNAERPHVGAGRAPIGHEQPFNSSATKGLDEAVSRREVRHGRDMQRQRGAEQGRGAILGGRKVAEPHAVQFQRNLSRRGAFRLLCSAGIVGAGREFQQLRRHRRGGFNGRSSGERRPEERRVRELIAWIPIHLQNARFAPWCLELVRFRAGNKL
jgi:hypothetical protein